SFLLTAPDILFWSILAVLVVVNTLYEASRGRKRTLGQHTLHLGDIAGQACRSAATFTAMAVLWSLWSSDSIQDWIALLSVVKLNLENITALLLSFLGLTVVFGLTIWMGARAPKSAGSTTEPSAFFRPAATTAGAIVLILLMGNPVVYSQIGGKAQALIHDLTVNRLSDREAALLQQGYYEDLIGVSRFNSQLWEIYTKRPSDWVAIRDTVAVRSTNDNLIIEMA